MNPEHTVTIAGKKYPILINVYGATKLERALGQSLFEVAVVLFNDVDPEHFRKASAEERGQMVLSQLRRFSIERLQGLLYAGLEGGRRAFRPQDPPFDWDQTGEMLIEGGGYMGLGQTLILALADFLPKIAGTAQGSNGDQAEGAAPKNPPTRKTRGKRSTKGRSSQA